MILTEFHQESPANNITGRAKSKEKRINKNNKGGQSQVFNGDRWIRTSPSDTAPEFLWVMKGILFGKFEVERMTVNLKFGDNFPSNN